MGANVSLGGLDWRTADSSGFTLIELVIVVAVLAALVAVAIPEFSRLYARVRIALERDDIERQLTELPQRVQASGRGGIPRCREHRQTAPAAPPADGQLEQWQALGFDLPEGWKMQVPAPVFYHFTGACDGGEIVFSLSALSLRYVLTASPVPADASLLPSTP